MKWLRKAWNTDLTVTMAEAFVDMIDKRKGFQLLMSFWGLGCFVSLVLLIPSTCQLIVMGLIFILTCRIAFVMGRIKRNATKRISKV